MGVYCEGRARAQRSQTGRKLCGTDTQTSRRKEPWRAAVLATLVPHMSLDPGDAPRPLADRSGKPRGLLGATQLARSRPLVTDLQQLRSVLGHGAQSGGAVPAQPGECLSGGRGRESRGEGTLTRAEETEATQKGSESCPLVQQIQAKVGPEPRPGTPAQGLLLGVQRPLGTTLLFLGWPSVSSPPPPIHQHSQDLCGEALGKRGPLSSIRPAGGLAHASPAGLSFLRAASQPPPTPWLLPSSIISWSLRVLAGIPAKRWWGVPSPTPSPHFLIHTLAPELWERRTAAGHWCQALPNLSPLTLDREDKEQALPPGPGSPQP